jgi:hypothetical protein
MAARPFSAALLVLAAPVFGACNAQPHAPQGSDAAPAGDAAPSDAPTSASDGSPADQGPGPADAGADAGPAPDARWPSQACYTACTGTWSLVTHDRPSFRSLPYPNPGSPLPAIYDPAGQRMLLTRAPSNFVWSLPFTGPNANTWSLLADQGDPAPAIIRSAAYDSRRRHMIVLAEPPAFPGVHAPALYALDLTADPAAWHPLGGQLPPAADLGAFVFYDANGDRLIMVGGTGLAFTASASSAASWTQLHTIGPRPIVTRFDKDSAVFDAEGERVIYLSAETSVFALSIGAGRWDPLPDLPARTAEHHAAVYDPPNRRVVVFGGEGAWALSLTSTPTWSQVQATIEPAYRFGEAAIYDSDRARMVIAGGMVFDSMRPIFLEALHDAWALSLTSTPAWSVVVPNDLRPSYAVLPRGTTAYDSARNELIVVPSEYGVVPDETLAFRAWRLSLTATPAWSPIQTSTSPAAPRVLEAFASVGTSDQLLYVGADHPDTWTFDPASATWTDVLAAGAPKVGSNGVYVPNLGTVIVATSSTSTESAGAWAFKQDAPGPRWEQIRTTGMPPYNRLGSSLVYDPENRRLIIFGGETDDFEYDDLWSLDLTRDPAPWKQEMPLGDAPGRTYGHFAIYDPARRAMILIRGDYANNLEIVHACGPRADDVFILNLDGPLEWARISAKGRFAVPAGPAQLTPSGTLVFDAAVWRLVLDACN